MIGVYDYTVILTYLSLLSGASGIIVCLKGIGHPYLGMFFLLFSGLCDTFDGKVARSKKNRTEREKRFGIQIDSLSDLVAFGVKDLTYTKDADGKIAYTDLMTKNPDGMSFDIANVYYTCAQWLPTDQQQQFLDLQHCPEATAAYQL